MFKDVKCNYLKSHKSEFYKKKSYSRSICEETDGIDSLIGSSVPVMKNDKRESPSTR